MKKRNKLVKSPSFEKAFVKFVKKFPYLKQSIERSLVELEENCFSEKLKTHKLGGKLFGAYACSCGYDCRIVFSFEKDSSSKGDYILLADIGTHESVY